MGKRENIEKKYIHNYSKFSFAADVLYESWHDYYHTRGTVDYPIIETARRSVTQIIIII